MTSPADASDPPPGAQAERTRLAWVRTAITIIVGAVIALRVTVEDVGPTAIAVTVGCAVAAGAVLVASRHRYRRAAGALDAPADLPDGRLPAVAGVIVISLGVLVIVFAAV